MVASWQETFVGSFTVEQGRNVKIYRVVATQILKIDKFLALKSECKM